MENKPEEEKEIIVKVSEWEKMQERMKRLEASAHKARLAHYDEQQRGDLGKIVGIRTYEGKHVKGWELLKNRPEKNPKTGVWEDNQIIRLHFVDAPHQDMPYVTFVRRYGKVKCEVQKESIGKKGKRELTVLLPNEKELTLGVEFVN